MHFFVNQIVVNDGSITWWVAVWHLSHSILLQQFYHHSQQWRWMSLVMMEVVHVELLQQYHTMCYYNNIAQHAARTKCLIIRVRGGNIQFEILFQHLSSAIAATSTWDLHIENDSVMMKKWNTSMQSPSLRRLDLQQKEMNLRLISRFLHRSWGCDKNEGSVSGS